MLDLFRAEYGVKYPKVNYIGNKEKLAKWIVDHFPVKEGKVLDLFSGGASVSFEAKKNDYTVYSNDALYASYVIGKTLIENKNIHISEEDIYKALDVRLSIDDRRRYTWLENYLFFPEEVDELAKLVIYSKSLEGYRKYFFQALIRRAMIRKLPYSRMNVNWDNIKKLRNEEYSYKKYGRKRAYHNVSFSDHMRASLEEYQAAVFDNRKCNKAFQRDALELLSDMESVDIIYMDPPYPSTMNNYESFYGAFDKLFEKETSHLNLTKKEDFLSKLDELIQLAVKKTKFIVFSLNSSSNPSIYDVEQILSKYGKTNIIRKKHNYQVSGKEKKNQNIELLAILEVHQVR